MIPSDYIIEWRAEAPWVEDAKVEQDLIITKALVNIFSHPVLKDALAFRGGTALYKLFLKAADKFDILNRQIFEFWCRTVSRRLCVYIHQTL